MKDKASLLILIAVAVILILPACNFPSNDAGGDSQATANAATFTAVQLPNSPHPIPILETSRHLQ